MDVRPSPPLDAAAASQRVKLLAQAHGFPLCGIASLPADGVAPGAERLEAWLQAGFQGPLTYLERNASARKQCRDRFPWAQSILALGVFYANPAAPQASAGLLQGVARYARGKDYHKVLDKRLRKLGRALSEAQLCSRAHGYADTGPILERSWAQQAGLGWIGKNTALIHPQYGSYFFLAELLMDTLLQPDAVTLPHCGTCRCCLDACPTHALLDDGRLDARLCLTTWNIEMRNLSAPELWEPQGGRVFGCDICQEVCPHNQPHRKVEADPEFSSGFPWQSLSLQETIELDAAQFDLLFQGSPLRRGGWKGLRLGAITAAGNLGVKSCEGALRRCLLDPDEAIRERAAWALEKWGAK